jgi:hypothetical protein
MWVGSMTMECVNYFIWVLEQIGNIHLLNIHTSKLNLEIQVELYSRHYA